MCILGRVPCFASSVHSGAHSLQRPKSQGLISSGRTVSPVNGAHRHFKASDSRVASPAVYGERWRKQAEVQRLNVLRSSSALVPSRYSQESGSVDMNVTGKRASTLRSVSQHVSELCSMW
jgi:hypothetical protein